ncbi:hypothetical protein CC2G_013409 [Coprinopsis cinerea AmutBmut pab1-1]|nr:hypothetical protein CC2G_013409 [Coprinopsis cinerea AmutBmut pab1-1]
MSSSTSSTTCSTTFFRTLGLSLGVALLFVASLIPSARGAPFGSPPGRRTHYICGPTDPFCQFFEVCDVKTRPNCPCIDSEGPGKPVFTHACPPFHSCEPFSEETRWTYHVCRPMAGGPVFGPTIPLEEDEGGHAHPDSEEDGSITVSEEGELASTGSDDPVAGSGTQTGDESAPSPSSDSGSSQSGGEGGGAGGAGEVVPGPGPGEGGSDGEVVDPQ